MRALSAGDILCIDELGCGKPSWYQALLVLAPAFPEVRPEVLAELSLGRRNHLLLKVREHLEGPTLEAVVKCPRCRVALELRLNAAEMAGGDAEPRLDKAVVIEVHGFRVEYRLPSTRDAASGWGPFAEEGCRRAIVTDCISRVSEEDQAVGLGTLSEREAILRSVEASIQEKDPLADIRVALSCVACRHVWEAPFDIAAFFWIELRRRSESLFGEVHLLATAYGWSEADILSMSPVRRRHYVDSLRGE